MYEEEEKHIEEAKTVTGVEKTQSDENSAEETKQSGRALQAGG